MPFAENDGVKIRWEEQGSGPPLLLIMGLGYTLDMWYRQLPALAERRRVLVFDNRGVGESDVPDGPYTMAQMAGDALAVGSKHENMPERSMRDHEPARLVHGQPVGAASAE